MRIACLQFGPRIGELNSNINRANEIIDAARLPQIDLLILPELAFIGYNHPSLPAIAPYLESTSNGPSTQWAKATAARLKCTVTVGYAELYRPSSILPSTLESDAEDIIAFNSTVTVAPSGIVLAHYRKSHLYFTDETWAQPSPEGWLSTPLTFVPETGPESKIKACFGICMDLNPWKFQAPWTDYEFASYALASQSEILILSMAWLTNLSSSAIAQEKNEPDMDTLNYWIERLRPLLMAEKEVLVACANRCGEEPGRNPVKPDGEYGVRYAGSSWVGLIGKGEVKLWSIIGRMQESLLVVDTAEEPRWTWRI